MSIEIVKDQIRRFLSSNEPEVICIGGRWGVGKTYAWKKYLKDAHDEADIALKRYSYVSLFGVNSLDELKYAIFENSVKSSDVGAELTLEALRSNTTAAAEQFVRKSLRVIKDTPFAGAYLGGLGPVWFSSVRETIVCIDDIERRGDDLAAREVLGLVSALKEQKKCKVALILNDEALEGDKSEYLKYYEKVVDASLKFEPSPKECAQIALPGNTQTERLLSEDCMMLGISNIRLIKRIERSVRGVEPMLIEFDEGVLRQAVHSLALLGWSIYAPAIAPSLEYLKKMGGLVPLGLHKDKTLPEEEVAWNALLGAYGFSGMDEFDLVLLEGIKNGFFDPRSLEKRAAALDNQIRAAKLDNSFSEAWGLYHDSFDGNQEEVLDAMYQAALKGARRISPPTLSGTVSLFKELGRPEQAAEIIEHYVESQGEDRKVFDLQNYPFAGDVKDPDVIKAFKNEFAAFKSDKDPGTILLSMANTNSWGPEDVTALSELPVEDYYNMFKNVSGPDLRKIISACLQFDRFVSATPEMMEIPKRARDALRRIGKESKINARRVRTYGVEIDSA
jgi:hypothetical protein